MPSGGNSTPRFPYKADRLKPLRAFCQTTRLGSVSRAAEALYVSQPAITLQLQALERELGQKLFERSDKFDHILVETSGLADPTPVATAFFVDPEVARQVKLDGVVTLVDAVHIESHLDDPALHGFDNQAVDQIVAADRTIINKIDLAEEPQLAALERRIRGINEGAQILRSSHAQVDLGKILGIAVSIRPARWSHRSAFSMPTSTSAMPTATPIRARAKHAHSTPVGISTDPSVDSSRCLRRPFDRALFKLAGAISRACDECSA